MLLISSIVGYFAGFVVSRTITPCPRELFVDAYLSLILASKKPDSTATTAIATNAGDNYETFIRM